MMEKMDRLESILSGMGDVLVAFSGGVDSTLLLYVASKFLGDRVTAATVLSPLFSAQQEEQARDAARQLNVRYLTPSLDIFSCHDVVANPPQRCYHCKQAMFQVLQGEAKRLGIASIVDASQTDDVSEFRPGLLALMELGVRSPMAEAGLTKADVRHYSRVFNLPGADRPPATCLATRIPFGKPITSEALKRVAAAEIALEREGFVVCRVRDHFPAAVIEVPPGEVAALLDRPLRMRLSKAIKRAGYTFVALDLDGYRSGSLCEVLETKEEKRPRL